MRERGHDEDYHDNRYYNCDYGEILGHVTKHVFKGITYGLRKVIEGISGGGRAVLAALLLARHLGGDGLQTLPLRRRGLIPHFMTLGHRV